MFHLLGTRRTERFIEEHLNLLVLHTVCMHGHGSLIDSDIQGDLLKALDHDLYNSGLGRWMGRKLIDSTLILGLNWMECVFLPPGSGLTDYLRFSVRCQLDALQKCRSSAVPKKSLKSLQKTLYKTRDRVLKDIAVADRGEALRMLQWLPFPVCAILRQEAVEALATDPEPGTGSRLTRVGGFGIHCLFLLFAPSSLHRTPGS